MGSLKWFSVCKQSKKMKMWCKKCGPFLQAHSCRQICIVHHTGIIYISAKNNIKSKFVKTQIEVTNTQSHPSKTNLFRAQHVQCATCEVHVIRIKYKILYLNRWLLVMKTKWQIDHRTALHSYIWNHLFWWIDSKSNRNDAKWWMVNDEWWEPYVLVWIDYFLVFIFWKKETSRFFVAKIGRKLSRRKTIVASQIIRPSNECTLIQFFHSTII